MVGDLPKAAQGVGVSGEAGEAIRQFLYDPRPVLDVRSPAEFTAGHLPGAHNLPLFDDSQRSSVGTVYRREGRPAAIDVALRLVGPRLADLVESARRLAPQLELRLYCWRGGMRSASVAWLLRTAGFQVAVLPGGYKAFRRWCREQWSRPRRLLILAGRTGTGKTRLLAGLAELGQAVLDLEDLAQHRGSSFGGLGMPQQPTQAQFENRLAWHLGRVPPDQWLWLESESRYLGKRLLPEPLFQQMLAAPWLIVQRSLEQRLQILCQEYGGYPAEQLIEATLRIERRLGGQHARQAAAWIAAGKLEPAIEIILQYYDKLYDRHLAAATAPQVEVHLEEEASQPAARRLLEAAGKAAITADLAPAPP